MFLFFSAVYLYLFFTETPIPRSPLHVGVLAYFLANATIYPLAKKMKDASSLDLDDVFD